MVSSEFAFGIEKGIMTGYDVVCVDVGDDDCVIDSGTNGR